MHIASDRQRPRHGRKGQHRVEMWEVLAARGRTLPFQRIAQGALVKRDQQQIIGTDIVAPQRLRELGGRREMDKAIGAILG